METTVSTPRELTKIYFGPKITRQDRSDLVALLAHGLEHVEAHDAVAGTARERKFTFSAVSRP